jgi:Ca2+-binding EF-hand superfamily protein
MLLVATILSATLAGQEVLVPSANEAAAIVDSNPNFLATLIEKLAPASRKDLAEMLASDWKDRPEWAEMLITMLAGQEMGPGAGWYQRSQKKHDWEWFYAKFDINQDGHVARDELSIDAPYAELLFPRLDRDNDGRLLSADFDYLGRQQPTPPQMLSQFLSSVLDADSNGRISPEELQSLLTRADKDKTGFLTGEDLYGEFSRAFSNAGGDDMPSPDEMLSMFFRGELGVWDAGPKLGDEAPDFTLPTHDGSQTITLSASRGKPVILIFGSFT